MSKNCNPEVGITKTVRNFASRPISTRAYLRSAFEIRISGDKFPPILENRKFTGGLQFFRKK